MDTRDPQHGSGDLHQEQERAFRGVMSLSARLVHSILSQDPRFTEPLQRLLDEHGTRARIQRTDPWGVACGYLRDGYDEFAPSAEGIGDPAVVDLLNQVERGIQALAWGDRTFAAELRELLDAHGVAELPAAQPQPGPPAEALDRLELFDAYVTGGAAGA